MKRLTAALLVLSFCSGATDAFAFINLGGIFTANMTGNLILVSLIHRPGYLVTLLGAGIAIVVFSAALLLGFRLTTAPHPNGQPKPHPRVITILAIAALAQALVTSIWAVVDARPHLPMQIVLVALSAVAM